MIDDLDGRVNPGHPPPAELRKQLLKAPSPYILTEPHNPFEAGFYFLGPFEGHDIIWQARLMTLEHYVQSACEKGEYRSGDTIMLQQFIEISDEDKEPLPILIVHDIPAVDEARILKTVIMIRNYKRLHRGIHTYGERHRFDIEANSD